MGALDKAPFIIIEVLLTLFALSMGLADLAVGRLFIGIFWLAIATTCVVLTVDNALDKS